MKTTLNGQLLLSILAENLVNGIDDLQILQINTDGITIKINRNCLEDYYNICKGWEFNTNLQLEYVNYSKMVIRDVNNYLSVKLDDKIKYKGAFEIEKEYHKDNSFKIVPIALNDYFVKGISVEQTIKNHKNIYDFCGREKFRGEDYGEMNYLIDNSHVVERQQKNVRFYISTNGGRFIKYYNSGGNEFLYKKYKVTIFNKYIEKDNYNIDYQFYINECNKIIRIIEDKQLDLFE